MRTGALGGSLVLLGLLPALLGGPVWLRAAGLVPGFGIVYATPTPGWSAELVPWLLLNLVVLLAVVAGLLTGCQRHYARTDRAGSPSPTDADWGGGANRANALGWSMFLARARSAPWYRRLRDAARNLENPPAEFRMFDASVHANGILGLGAVTDERTWRDMLLTPSRHPGPRLTEVPWPDIAVVTATTDAAQRRHRLGFDRLIPHRTYTVDGATAREVTADATGRAVVEIELRSRHHLRLTRR